MVVVTSIRSTNGSRHTAPVLVVHAQGSHLLHRDVSADAILTLDPHGYILSSSAGATEVWHLPIEDIVGRHMSCLCPPQGDRLAGALAGAVRHGTHTESGWRVRTDGSRFWAETVITATRDTDAHLAGFSVVVRDMSVHLQHLRLLHAVGEVNRSVLDGGADDEVLTLIARRVREAVGAEVARVLALDRGGVLTVRAVDGVQDSAPCSLPMPEESALAYEAIRAGQPKVFSDTGRTSPEYRSALRDAGLMSVLDTPLGVHGHTVGVIEVVNRRGGRRFTSDDLQTVGLFTGAAGVAVGQARVHENLCRPARTAPVGQDSLSDIGILQAIAGEAAAAVERDRLWAVAQEKASREERQRLSRELHDTVSHALYGIALGARTAHEMLGRDVTKVAEPIDYIRQLADAGLAEMRALLFELRPDSLETQGLVVALAKHVDALRTRYGITAEAMLGAEPETTPEAKHALYRIAQESLHNVAKHSRARHVLLRLLNGPGTVTLVVTDDGVGFDSQASFPGHLGLRSMHERAREVGGTLKVDSRPGQGSRIRATVPARP